MPIVATHRFVAACAAVLFAVPLAAGAQSLADVARAEEARRKQQPKAAKVYTNESVTSDITPSAPPGADRVTPVADSSSPAAPSAAASSAAPQGAGNADAAPAAAGSAARDQAYWKGRITAAREQLERANTLAEALQTRINALTADFVNRDDPAQQTLVGQNRVKAVAELERVQREIDTHTKAIAAIEDEARKAGVPAGWLR